MVGWRGLHLFLQGNNNISFFNGSGEVARMDGDGRVMIGFTVMSTSAGNDRISLQTSKGIAASQGTSSSNDWNDFWGNNGPSLVAGTNGYVGTNGSFGMDIVGNGYRNTSNTWTSLSSYNSSGTTRSIISMRPTTGSGGGILFGCDAATTGTQPTIRGRFSSGGAFIVSTDDSDGANPIGSNKQGFSVMGNTNGGGINMHVTSGDLIKMEETDGTLIKFFKNAGGAAEQGNISMH